MISKTINYDRQHQYTMIDYAKYSTHREEKYCMKQIILLLLLTLSISAFALDDYYIKKAQNHQCEAEYYQKKVDSYRREAEYYLKKADYQRESAYYTRNGDLDSAKSNSRYAETQWITITQLRYATQADEKVTMYLRWSVEALRKQ